MSGQADDRKAFLSETDRVTMSQVESGLIEADSGLQTHFPAASGSQVYPVVVGRRSSERTPVGGGQEMYAEDAFARSQPASIDEVKFKMFLDFN